MSDKYHTFCIARYEPTQPVYGDGSGEKKAGGRFSHTLNINNQPTTQKLVWLHCEEHALLRVMHTYYFITLVRNAGQI